MPDEVGALDNKKCILFFRGLSPYLSDKFPLEKHKRYKELFNENTGKNRFNFEVLGADKLSYENFQEEYREDLYKIEEGIGKWNTWYKWKSRERYKQTCKQITKQIYK